MNESWLAHFRVYCLYSYDRGCPAFRDFRKVGTTQPNPKVHSFRL